MKYNDKVLEEFFNPENVGVIKGASGVGKVVSAEKEIVKLYIMVEGKKIVEATFQAYGCTSTIACCSVAAKMVKGKTIDDALNLTAADIEKELDGLPIEKKHSAELAEKMIKSAIKNLDKKNKESKDED